MINKIFLLHHRDDLFKKRYDYITKRLEDEKLDFEVVDLFRPEDIDYDNLIKNHEKFTSIFIEQINEHSYNNFSKKINSNSLSLVLKHIYCWEQQIKYNYDYCMILEDDCEIPELFYEKIQNIMSEVRNKNCDLVMVGTAFDFISPNIIYDNNIHFHPNQKTRCTHAYIISNNCAKKMIEGFGNINLPIDFKMNEVIQIESIKVFWYEPGLKQIES